MILRTTHPDQVTKRRLYSGEVLTLWADGDLTDTSSFRVAGWSLPRSVDGKRQALAAGWLLMGEAEIFELDELPALIKAAKWGAKRDAIPGDVRAKASEILRRAAAPVPSWEVTEADSRGATVARQWRPSRLSPWGRYGVIDDRRMREGRYLLAPLVGPDTIGRGLHFRRLGDLLDFMAEPGNQPRLAC